MPGINAPKDDKIDPPSKVIKENSGLDSEELVFSSADESSVVDVVPVKVCPNGLCRQTDQTDFSTCRYCGANYDTRMQTFGRAPIDNGFSLSEFAMRPFGIVIILALGLIAYNLSASILGGAITSTQRNAAVTVDTETANLREHPQDYQSLIRRGDAYWAKSFAQLAFDDYSSAIKIDPMKPEAYDKRALMYDNMGSYNLAIQDRDTAKKLRH